MFNDDARRRADLGLATGPRRGGIHSRAGRQNILSGKHSGEEVTHHAFCYDDYRLDGIEQNPETTSRWAALAREGKQVMQFSYQHRYVASVCEGKLSLSRVTV